MPLYEGVGIVGDKHAVVFDVGHVYTKCGFATEPSPRCIIPSTVYNVETGREENIFDDKWTDEQREELLLKFFYNVYFRHLLISPKERRVVIVESLLTPCTFRNMLAKVFFTRFSVVSLIFCPTHLLACFPLGIQTALVVDVGYRGTEVMPVYDGYPLLSYMEASSAGGQAFHKNVKKLLEDHCSYFMSSGKVPVKDYPDALTEKVLEDIKVRTCFVTHPDRGRKFQEAIRQPDVGFPTSAPSVEYPLDEDKILLLEGLVREASAEVLFDRGGEDRSIPDLILACISRCPVDIRKIMAENILVIGGGCMLPGFMARLKEELINSYDDDPRPENQPLKSVKFYQHIVLPNYAAWAGGSIFGGLEVLAYRSISQEEYKLNQEIPDWTDRIAVKER